MSCHNEHTHSHSHSHSGDDSNNDHVPPIPTSSAQDLSKYIDTPRLTALNSDVPNSELSKLFIKSESEGGKYSLKSPVSSDLDAQLILNIPFTGYVKLYSIILRTAGDEEQCPKEIKVYKNAKDVDFDNERKPQFTITHPQIGVLADDGKDQDLDDSNFVEHHLPRSSFQSTTNLTLFIQNNWADDEDESIKIFHIELRGQFQSPLAKEPIITLYEAAANPADHKNLIASVNKNYSSI
ncbi:hypothetical protein WICPIJ_009974 [Wickerhamomyces pijperi]|uniref:PITH domain-containing protein n=1 Tax=Wickerhamomyces pijperi TaxID=599730 RepID=A0A9P8TC08_WICPI|nr:hypothetical protein WICPIJ_009974 [Wickerhamomyces pijperi]